MTEVELKFEVDRAAHERLKASPVLAGAVPRSLRMSSIYFDTPSRDLAASGMSLRLRRSGRRWVQCLKAGRGATGGLHSRDQWEFDRPGARLDLSLFSDTPLASLDEAATLHQRLAPVFRVEVRRTAWDIAPAEGCLLEVVLDEGAVEGSGRREALSELEIECVEGDAGHAFDLALRLLDEVAMRPSALTKAARGYRLAGRARLHPARALPVELDAALSPGAAARALVKVGLDQLQANEEGVLRDTDAEFVHQARVALRRMRSALRMFRDAVGVERAQSWLDELSEVTRALGDARDWDVFAAESLPPIVAAYGDAALARKLSRRASLRRRRDRAAAREAIRSPRYARVILALSRWIAQRDDEAGAASAEPLAGFASRLVRKRHKRLIAGLEALPGLGAEDRHRVRIDAKRLRYVVEGLASIFSKRGEQRYARRLADLQDALGRANDAATGARILAEIDPPEAFAAFARGWLAARMQPDPALLAALGARLSASPRFWRRKSSGRPTQV